MPNPENPKRRERNRRTFAEVLHRIYPNESMEKAIETCERFFRSAKKSIKIVSGRLNSEFYQSTKIVNALQQAVDKGVKVEIVCGPEIDEKSKEILRLIKEGKINLWQAGDYPKLHLSFVDERHIRLENYHHPFYGEETEAYIKYNAPDVARELQFEFEELKEGAARTRSPKLTPRQTISASVA